jgi:uncharacterized protein (DUF58 family)
MRATREGKRFGLATLLIMAASFNTGNNLIYLILALMLSLILLSVVILKINLSGLSLGVSPLSPVFAGEEAAFSITLKNGKRFVPSYSLNVQTKDMDSRTYYPLVPPGDEGTKTMPILFPRRGLYGHGDFIVSSGFPFILCTGSNKIKVSGEVLVYPALLDVEEALAEIQGFEEDEAVRTAGSGEEIYSLRGFRYGDDLRQIHWKASAKVSDLMVKEYAEYESKKATIILDNLKTGDIRGGNEEVFERAVSLAASLAKFFIDRGHFVRVVSCRKVIPFGTGDGHLCKIFDILATVSEEGVWESPLPGEDEGSIITVLKTSRSPLQGLSAAGDFVVHAETL